jgi:hypothetical protein
MVQILFAFILVASSHASAFRCESYKSRGYCQFKEPQHANAKGCLDIVGKFLLLEDLLLCQESTTWSNSPCPTAKHVAYCEYGDTDHLIVRHFYPPYTKDQAVHECIQSGGEPCAQ